MLQFSNISPTGYVITRLDGSQEQVTGKLYNNDNGTAHLVRENNILYEVYLNRYIARSDKVCTFIVLEDMNEWIIPHNFNSAVIVHVLRHDGLMVYPKRTLLIDYNTIKLVYDTMIHGRAIVRVT